MSFNRTPVNYNLSHSYSGIELFLDVDQRDMIRDIGYKLSGRDSYRHYMEEFCGWAIGKKFEDLDASREPSDGSFIGPLELLIYRLKCDWQASSVPINLQSGKKWEELLCRCFGVGTQEIINYFSANPLASLRDITKNLKAGGGCTSCLFDLEKIQLEFRRKMNLITNERRKRFKGHTPLEAVLKAEDLIIDLSMPAEIVELRDRFLVIRGTRDSYDHDLLAEVDQKLMNELSIKILFTDEDSPYCIS